MMADGVLQAMGVASLVPSILDRSMRDQLFGAAHILVGVALVAVGRRVSASEAMANSRPAVYALVAALAVALGETSWFNWLDTVGRALYTGAAIAVLTRSTNLPTASPDSR